MEIHVVLFKGIPEAAFFYKERNVTAYLEKEGTSLKKVLEDMENNPMAEWKVYTIKSRQGIRSTLHLLIYC